MLCFDSIRLAVFATEGKSLEPPSFTSVNRDVIYLFIYCHRRMNNLTFYIEARGVKQMSLIYIHVRIQHQGFTTYKQESPQAPELAESATVQRSFKPHVETVKATWFVYAPTPAVALALASASRTGLSDTSKGGGGTDLSSRSISTPAESARSNVGIGRKQKARGGPGGICGARVHWLVQSVFTTGAAAEMVLVALGALQAHDARGHEARCYGLPVNQGGKRGGGGRSETSS